MSNAPRDLYDFEGNWTLERKIEDRLAGRSGQLIGSVALSRDDEGLVFRETGEMTFPGQPPLTASRVYLWRRGRGGAVNVFFENGAPFHDFTLARTMPEASHFCDPDMYNVTYNLTRWPMWTSDWRVVGPRKNYRLLSSYSRS